MKAVFICTQKDLVDEVRLDLKRTPTTEAEIKEGKYFAARRFKRRYDLYPTSKVKVDFVGVVE